MAVACSALLVGAIIALRSNSTENAMPSGGGAATLAVDNHDHLASDTVAIRNDGASISTRSVHPEPDPAPAPVVGMRDVASSESTELTAEVGAENSPESDTLSQDVPAVEDEPPAMHPDGESGRPSLAYLDNLIVEGDINPSGFDAGRPLQNSGTITEGSGKTTHLSRSYRYDANGIGTVTDNSHTTHQDPNAETFQFNLTETLDQFARTLSLRGTMESSTGETVHVDRVYAWDANGLGRVTDKSRTSHENPDAMTYRYNLTDTINQIGQSFGAEGTATGSRGRVWRVTDGVLGDSPLEGVLSSQGVESSLEEDNAIGGSTPRDVLTRYNESVAAGRYQEAYNCFTAESLDVLIGLMVLGVAVASSDDSADALSDKAEEALAELLENHGLEIDALSAPDTGSEPWKNVRDKAALLAGLTDWSQMHLEADARGEAVLNDIQASEIMMRGETAAASLADGTGLLQFRRIGEVWYIDLVATIR